MKNSTSKNKHQIKHLVMPSAAKIFTLIEGKWQLERNITDKLAGNNMQGTGQAEFSKIGLNKLHYTEQLTLTSELNEAKINANQEYYYKLEDDDLVKYFKDGRLFYKLIINAESIKGYHLCNKDEYRADYKLVSKEQGFTISYQIIGPKKDMLIETKYYR